MDILVTGGTVFASRAAAQYFADSGHNVFVLNRGTRPQPQNVTPIIADRHSLGDRLKHRHFDAVLDVTAYDSDDVNDLLDSLGCFGTYVLISSSAVYPETLPSPFSESYKCGANSIWGKYGSDKISAENALLSRVSDAYILRPPYLCGYMNNLYREAFVFECAEAGRPFYLPSDGSMKLQFFHIGDLCRLTELILNTSPADHIFNTGYPMSVSIRDWVKLCYESVGREPEFINVPKTVPQRSYFPFYDYQYELDVSRMNSILSDLTPLEDSVAGSYEWFRNNRELIIKKPLIQFIDSELKEIMK